MYVIIKVRIQKFTSSISNCVKIKLGAYTSTTRKEISINSNEPLVVTRMFFLTEVK
jgi:hypothetical protein